MLAVRNGDIDQLGALFDKFHSRLFNFFFMHTGHRQSSEDMVQDVFLRMLKYKHTYRGEGKFTTWMFSIAHNTKIDYYRKSKKAMNFSGDIDLLAESELNPEERVGEADNAALLKKALAGLSEDKREVLVLSRFHHMKYEEIASILNCKVGTVKARVFRALKELSGIYYKLTGE